MTAHMRNCSGKTERSLDFSSKRSLMTWSLVTLQASSPHPTCGQSLAPLRSLHRCRRRNRSSSRCHSHCISLFCSCSSMQCLGTRSALPEGYCMQGVRQSSLWGAPGIIWSRRTGIPSQRSAQQAAESERDQPLILTSSTRCLLPEPPLTFVYPHSHVGRSCE